MSAPMAVLMMGLRVERVAHTANGVMFMGLMISTLCLMSAFLSLVVE